MDKITKALQFIKDNLNLFILIPTILGGFWQLIELVCLDIAFIRFFSLTQVISDGLLILFLSILAGFMYYILFIKFFNLPIFKIKKENKSEEEAKEFDRENPLKSSILYAIICLVVILFMYFGGNLTTFKKGILIYMIISFFSYVFDIVRITILKNYKYNRTTVFLALLTPMLLFQMDAIAKSFHRMFIPQKLSNVKYIECYIGKKQKEFELLYFNDKYIFVQIKKTQEIEIINFEEMLKKDNCDTKEKGNK